MWEFPAVWLDESQVKSGPSVKAGGPPQMEVSTFPDVECEDGHVESIVSEQMEVSEAQEV